MVKMFYFLLGRHVPTKHVPEYVTRHVPQNRHQNPPSYAYAYAHTITKCEKNNKY